MPNRSALYAYAKSNIDQEGQQSQTHDSQHETTLQRVVISDQNIDLPISASSVVNGEWQVSTQGVSLLSSYTEDKNKGYVLFGHDWPVLLGRMRQSKIGQSISLKYGNGKEEKYKIVSLFTVSPTQLDILNLAKPKTLLIYTCSGFMDSKRFVVLAQLQE